ncbi:MAG: hypothetical protein ABR562_10200, partial [Thermoplasmatota archaeon]
MPTAKAWLSAADGDGQRGERDVGPVQQDDGNTLGGLEAASLDALLADERRLRRGADARGRNGDPPLC